MKLFSPILTLIFLISSFSTLLAAGSFDVDLTGWESFRSETVRSWDQLQNAGPEAVQWEANDLTTWTNQPDLICWYRASFDSPKLTDSQRAFLAFEWVKFGAQVRIDGKHHARDRRRDRARPRCSREDVVGRKYAESRCRQRAFRFSEGNHS